jgi:lipid-binding SYLF domain-containing protein
MESVSVAGNHQGGGHMRNFVRIMVVAAAALLAGCLQPQADKVQTQKVIEQMANNTLEQLYYAYPDTRNKVRASAGYAVFDSTNANLLLIGGGSGYGLCVNNGKGSKTYMNMAQFGIGPGLGVKDYRLVFVFKSQEVLTNFMEQGWEFGSQADATAKTIDKGGALSGQVSFQRDVEVYSLTSSGVTLQAMVAGTRYWPNADLN